MMTRDFSQLPIFIRQGKFQDVKRLLVENPSELEHVWYLLEAYLNLYELDRAEGLLYNWYSVLKSPKDWSCWSFYQAHFRYCYNNYLSALRYLELSKEFQLNYIDTKLKIKCNLIWIRSLFALDKTSDAIVSIRSIFENKEDILDLQLFGRALVLRGEGSIRTNEYEKAFTDFQEALTIAEDIGNPVDFSDILTWIGTYYHLKQEFVLASDYFEQALVLRMKLGNPLLISNSLGNIADLYESQGKSAESLIHYKRALAYAQQIDRIPNIIAISTKLEKSYRMQHKISEADACAKLIQKYKEQQSKNLY